MRDRRLFAVIAIPYVLWYNTNMNEVVKTVIGFVAILLVGLGGVTVSEVMKLGNMNSVIMTVDNISHAR